MLSRRQFITATTAASAATLAGCARRQTPVNLGNDKGILILGNGADPADLDPQIVTGLVEFKIMQALFEGLTSLDADGLKVAPGVAKSWEASDDQLTWTFNLNPEAKWSNGDLVTAEDFAFSWQRMLSPNLGAEYAYMLYVMVGAQAFNTGELTDFSQVGVKVINPHTLQLTLAAPTPYLLSVLSHQAWMPVHRPTILSHGEMDTRGTRWTRPGNHIGNGGFRLKRWNLTEVVELEANPHYWDRASYKLREIHFMPINDVNTEERAFRAEQLHKTDTVASNKVVSYKQAGDPALNLDPALGVYYYLINCRKPPLDDVRVRTALSYALDRMTTVEQITRRGELPAYNFTPPDTGGYFAEAKIKPNLDAARKLLADAGYPKGQGFPELEILYNTSEDHKAIAEAVQAMWKRELGIEVSLINQEWKTYLATRRTGTFQIARASWFGDYNDPNTFLNLLTSYSDNNHSGWENAKYDELIGKAARASDPQVRYDYFQQAEAVVLQEMPVIPIYFYVNPYLLNPSVKGWHGNILDQNNYKGVWLEEPV